VIPIGLSQDICRLFKFIQIPRVPKEHSSSFKEGAQLLSYKGAQLLMWLKPAT